MIIQYQFVHAGWTQTIVLSTYIPAWKASKVSPVDALRNE